MEYIETLARRIVTDVARVTTDRSIVWAQLEDIAERLKVTLPVVETGAKTAVDWGWLSTEGSLPRAVCLTAAGRALVRRVGL